MPAELRSSSHGQTLVLSLHNPEHHNALDPAMYAAGVEAFNAAGDNPEVRSVVLVGDGPTFCSGGNLRRLRANREQAPSVQGESIDALHLWISEIRAFPKPVIAAVEGAAAGAGFSLALACDFVVAARDAVFALSYCKVGLSPDGGSTWSLTHALPRALVNEIAMLGDRLPAERLHELGLVNRLALPGAALEDALALAERLNQRAPNALQSIKELVNGAPHATLAQQFEAERDHFVANLHHRNGGIGIEAFLGKTEPKFE